ncbi:response regulator [Nitrospira sp. BLG_2]|uniref:ATP-binding response regulator n=1 Tax=Nitrospira sp. BLG_2 TaxID=3397507 RepID=UPI003B9AD9CE
MNTPMTADHLLGIDPCPDTQSRIAEQLRDRGVSVVAVSDPTTALTTIDIVAPDIVITDLFLPEATGLTLLKELKARHELCPVIAMAKDAPEIMIVQALRFGAADYLHKPVTEGELAYALQRARNLLPADLTDIPGLCRSEYRLIIDSDPTHIPGVISWLVKTTASTLPPIRRLHLQGALQELLFNAIEHGNLEIHYKEKQQALAEGQYEQLLAHRIAQARLKNRCVIIHMLHDKGSNNLVYRITDEGKGFKWHGQFTRSQDVGESEDVNGRGIFLARSFFPCLAYNERGNEVTITVSLD